VLDSKEQILKQILNIKGPVEDIPEQTLRDIFKLDIGDEAKCTPIQVLRLIVKGLLKEHGQC